MKNADLEADMKRLVAWAKRYEHALWPERCRVRDSSAVDRTLTLSAAHRLISSLADQTNSRSELEECREVMNQLERMVEEG